MQTTMMHMPMTVQMIMQHIEVPQRTLETMSDEQFARSAGLPPAN